MRRGEIVRLLVVVGEPDDRESSEQLDVALDELERRDDVVLEVWYLREDGLERQRASRNVDDLREWWPAQLLGRVHEKSGRRLRGLQLRRWFKALAPDAVILDDGLGERLLPSAPGSPVVAVRHSLQGAPGAHREPAPTVQPALVISGDPADPRAAGREHLTMPDPLFDTGPAVRERLAAARRDARRRLGVPQDVALIVGWGTDSWIDGADLFVRVLWHLEQREGIVAHCLWFGLEDEGDMDLLLSDAKRCGAEGRLHLRPEGAESDHWCGDAVFLPHRLQVDSVALRAAAHEMMRVVTFEPLALEGPWVEGVGVLDLDAAARALAVALAPESADWVPDHDLGRWGDRLVETLGRLRSR